MRRAMVALAVVVLLAGWYVGAWLAVSRAATRGIVSGPVAVRMAPAFAPIRRYSGSDLPGSQWLSDVWWRANQWPSPPNIGFAPCDENGQITVLLDRESDRRSQ